MIEKIKRNWKRILLIGAASYLVIAIISTVVGGMLIKGRMDKMERHEDTIGKAFEERKADFQERFYKNWEDGLDSLSEGFKRTEKHLDKHGLDGLTGALSTAKKMLEKWPERPQDSRVELEQEISELAHHIPVAEAAFKKKWFSQRDAETLEQLERRQDEGEIDFQFARLDYYVMGLNWFTDEFKLEEWNQSLKRQKERLTYLQEKFQEKYGEPYDGTEFREACVVLQEQARKETQEFLDNLAAKQAAEEQKKELLPMVRARDEVIRTEKGRCGSPERSYLGLRHLHKLLGLYAEYNGLVAAFEEKWGVEAEEPLREYKAESDRKWARESIDWGFFPVDYLAKEKELEELLPKVELEFDTQFIADLRERIPIEEAELNRLQEKMNEEFCLVYPENIKWGEEKEKREKLQLRPSILALEEAFEKKWTPQTEEETIEQFERRQSEGNIQFLSALIGRFKIDRSEFRGEFFWERRDGDTKSAAQKLLSQAEKSFFVTYGEVCPQTNIVNIATN